MTIISDRIKSSRKQIKMTMDELAKEMNVTQATIVKWENGTVTPRLSKINELSKILDVDQAYLSGIQNEKKILPLSQFIDAFETTRKEKWLNYRKEQEEHFLDFDFEESLTVNRLFDSLDKESKKECIDFLLFKNDLPKDFTFFSEDS